QDFDIRKGSGQKRRIDVPAQRAQLQRARILSNPGLHGVNRPAKRSIDPGNTENDFVTRRNPTHILLRNRKIHFDRVQALKRPDPALRRYVAPLTHVAEADDAGERRPYLRSIQLRLDDADLGVEYLHLVLGEVVLILADTAALE